MSVNGEGAEREEGQKGGGSCWVCEHETQDLGHTFERKKGETGVGRQQVCVRRGWGGQIGLPGSHFLFLS